VPGKAEHPLVRLKVKRPLVRLAEEIDERAWVVDRAGHFKKAIESLRVLQPRVAGEDHDWDVSVPTVRLLAQLRSLLKAELIVGRFPVIIQCNEVPRLILKCLLKSDRA